MYQCALSSHLSATFQAPLGGVFWADFLSNVLVQAAGCAARGQHGNQYGRNQYGRNQSRPCPCLQVRAHLC